MKSFIKIKATGFKNTIVLFPNTPQGNRQSIKYCKDLKEEYDKLPFWYLYAEVKKYEGLNDVSYRFSAGKRRQIKSELEKLQKERLEFLQLMGYAETPPGISVTIEKV